LISYLELLEGRAGDDAERRTGYIIKGKHQAERIKLLVTKLLQLSRMENRESLEAARRDFSNFRIGDIVEGSLAAYFGNGFPNIELEANEDSLEEIIFCDYDIVTGMLQNVVGNSIKFSQMIHEKIEDVHVSIKVDLQGDREVLFTIIDNGPGILSADLPRVFDRFFRSSIQSIDGSGLGLAIVKSGASLHNGSVVLSNRESLTEETGLACKITGTVCKIILPLH